MDGSVNATEVSIDFPENRVIRINGEAYEVLLSDFEVLLLAEELSRKFAEAAKADNAEAAAQAVKTAYSLLDGIFGRGATKKILGGRSVCAAFLLENVITPVLAAVLGAAGDAYSAGIAEKYE